MIPRKGPISMIVRVTHLLFKPIDPGSLGDDDMLFLLEEFG